VLQSNCIRCIPMKGFPSGSNLLKNGKWKAFFVDCYLEYITITNVWLEKSGLYFSNHHLLFYRNFKEDLKEAYAFIS